MKKSIEKARRDFRTTCLTQNGKLRALLIPAVEEILNYKRPLMLKSWSRKRGSWVLTGAKLYENVLKILEATGSEYEVKNESRSGKNAERDVIVISPRGLKRAKAVLKDYIDDRVEVLTPDPYNTYYITKKTHLVFQVKFLKHKELFLTLNGIDPVSKPDMVKSFGGRDKFLERCVRDTRNLDEFRAAYIKKLEEEKQACNI